MIGVRRVAALQSPGTLEESVGRDLRRAFRAAPITGEILDGMAGRFHRACGGLARLERGVTFPTS